MVPKIVLLIAFACVAFANGTEDKMGNPPQPIPTNSTTTPITPDTTTTPTTTATTPTTTPTTTTTTTTSTPTTKGTSTSTSTTSTTTTLPTTQAPVLKPDIGKWNATDHSVNKTFILAEMAIQLNITYDTASGKRKCVILNIPKTASAAGKFGNDTQRLDISWFIDKDNTSSHFIIFFEKNSTDNLYMIRNITVNVTLPEDKYPDIKRNVLLYNNKTEFSTPLSKSYRCAKEQTFDLMEGGSNKTTGALYLSHVQLEAFHEKMDNVFDSAEDCERSTSPDIVPIAVGCALVGLVAIVLIAYLVGRRRSQARGYLSM